MASLPDEKYGRLHPGRGTSAVLSWACCVSSLLVLSVRPLAGQQTVTLEGQVRTDKGQVIPFGVNVRLETSEGQLVGQQPANSAGQFQFENLRKTGYHLTASAEGFVPTEQYIDLGYGGNRYVVNIVLSPAALKKQNVVDLPSLTDAKASKKAHKEYEKAARALEEKKLAEAQSHLEKAVAEYPCYARAQTDLSLVLTSLHNIVQAEAALRKAIECDPGFVNAYTQLGRLLNAEKKFAESATILQEGMRHSPGAWQFHYELAAAQFGLGQYPEAEEELLKAESLTTPTPPSLHVKLADVYLKEDAYGKAYAEMQAYLRAEPNGKFSGKIKGIMRQMEASGVLHPPAAEGSPPPPPKS